MTLLARQLSVTKGAGNPLVEQQELFDCRVRVDFQVV